MNTFRFDVSGSDKNLAELEDFCRQQGIATERGANKANNATITFLAVVYILAKNDAIPKCIQAFMRERKKRMKVFIPDKGWILLENYSEEEIVAILSKTDSLHIED